MNGLWSASRRKQRSRWTMPGCTSRRSGRSKCAATPKPCCGKQKPHFVKPASASSLRWMPAPLLAPGFGIFRTINSRPTNGSREHLGSISELCKLGLPLQRVASSIHPDDRPAVEKLIQDAIDRGGPYRAQYRVRQADGVYRWIEASGRCEHDAQGRAVRFPGVLIDIDEGKRVTQRLHEREADLELLLNSTADGFYAVDREGTTTRCNAAFLKMLEYV